MPEYIISGQKVLSDAEQIKLRKSLRRNRDSTIIKVGLFTGARASEILNLRFPDINHETKSLFFKGLKNSNSRELPLKPDLYEDVCRAFETRRVKGSDKIFQISHQRLFQIWDHYRIVNKKFHSLRHTFAVNLYLKTNDIRLLQKALGHKHLSTTEVYLDFTYTQTEMRRIILDSQDDD